MKKEGRQHGMIRIPTGTSPKFADKLSKTPPTAGLFVRISPKPTNPSGKSGRLRSPDFRVHHIGKSKDKAKGTQKQRSRDVVVSSPRLTTWRVANGGPGFKFSGLSATGILTRLAAADYLDYDYDYDYDYDDVHEESSCVLECFQPGLIVDLDYGSPSSVKIELEDYGDLNGGDDVDDDAMSFCEVGFVWEQIEGDEGWCLVEEM